MQLTAKVFVTLDGVYQGPGAPDEDRRFGFDRGGWQAGFGDDVLGAWIRAAYANADAMLLGQVTWAIWETYWPAHDDHPIGHTINTLPKHVPTTTRTTTEWANTHFHASAIESVVRELRAAPGRDLLLQGSGALLRWLLARDLVDELSLAVYPLVVGAGLRLFPEQGPAHALELVESTPTPSGIVLQTYRPKDAGAVRRRP